VTDGLERGIGSIVSSSQFRGNFVVKCSGLTPAFPDQSVTLYQLDIDNASGGQAHSMFRKTARKTSLALPVDAKFFDPIPFVPHP
jgi:hypothetical protein